MNHSSMGSSCSMQRHYDEYQSKNATRRNHNRTNDMDPRYGSSSRNPLRHSVVCAIPDTSIAALYPVEDNYINELGNVRSPKRLTDLCIDAVCRSLPYMNGEFPSGLPQDVVDDVIESLIHHSALTATTLRVLKNCELGSLSLSGCRGVTDAWLESLTHGSCTSSPISSPIPISPHHGDIDTIDPMDLEQIFTTNISTTNMHRPNQDDENIDITSTTMDHPQDIFYGTFGEKKWDDHSCSTSSFISATEGHHHHHECRTEPMDIIIPSSTTTSSVDVNHDVSKDQQEHHTEHDQQHYSFSSVTTNMTYLDIRGSYNLTDHGLIQLMNLSRLNVARLDHCHSITGRGLLAFCHSHELHTLSLANCRRLTDEAVINISHLLSLKVLSLDGCRCITDRSLTAIADLYHLTKLDLSQCDLITDRGIEQLDNLNALEELSLGWCRQVTDGGIDALTQHDGRSTNLRILRLARCPITDAGVEHLSRLLALEELDLNGCSSISSAALGSTLEKLKNLSVLDVSYCPSIIRTSWQGKINSVKTLDLCYSSVKDSHIVKFMNLSNLEELNLGSCLVGDVAIGHLADNNVVPNLTSLDLADTNLTDVGMVKIAKFTKLIRLSLFYCNITNGGLRHISKLTNLQVLNLDSRDISDDGLAYLQKLQQLKSLDVFSGRITDAGCVHIAKIKSLESLELCGGGIGDLGCSLLGSLDNLSSLNLSQNERITNRGAAALASLMNLKALNLSNTRVNSAALRFFGGLMKLQSLALYGCRGIDDENVLGKLRRGLPNLRCLRLHSVSDEDGMVIASEDDEISVDTWNNLHREMNEDDAFSVHGT